MATLDQDPSGGINCMIAAHPRTGKTGAIGQLLNCTEETTGKPYELFILDTSRQLQSIKNPNYVAREHHKRCHVIDLQERTVLSTKTGRSKPKNGAWAWEKTIELVGEWVDPDTGENFGDLADWGPERVLIIDDASSQYKIIENFMKALNNTAGKRNQWVDWEGIVGSQLDLWSTIRYCPKRQCQFFVLAHLQRLEYTISSIMSDEDIQRKAQEASRAASNNSVGIEKVGRRQNEGDRVASLLMYPVAATKPLSQSIPRLFPYIVGTKLPFGAEKPFIRCRPDGEVQYGVPATEDELESDLPISNGLHQLIKHNRMFNQDGERETV